MDLKRVNRLCVILVLVLSIFCVNVLGATPSSFDSFQLISLESQVHQQGGQYVMLDDIEFLTYVTTVYNLNIDYEKAFYSKPFSVQTIDLYKSNNFVGHYNIICMQKGNYTPKVSGWVSLNGNPVELTVGTPYVIPDQVFPFASKYNINNVHPYGNTTAVYNYYAAADVTTNLFCYRSSEDGVMDSIISTLNSINDNCVNIAMYTSNAWNTLAFILQAVNTSNNSLTDILSRLTSINSSLTTINYRIGLILESTQNIDAFCAYAEPYLDYFDQDLMSIDSSLQTLVSDFSTYSDFMIPKITDIGDDVSNIDDNVEEIKDHFNGEALKEVQVPGTNTNLFSIIWSGVQSGLGGLGRLFNAIFNGLGFFANSANSGFGYLDSIDQYQSVVYSPTDLSGG